MASKLLVCIAGVTAILCLPDSIRAQDLSGRVGTLPGAESSPVENALLDSHVKLLSTSLDQAIEDLEHGRLKQFAKSSKRMVEAYNRLSDQIGDAASSIGDAQVQVSLATDSLHSLGDAPKLDSAKRRTLTEDISQIRALMMGKLASLKALYEQANTEGDRAKLAQQLSGIVNRVKQLDALGNSLAAGTRPILPGVAANELRSQLDAIDDSLHEEERMLGVLAESVRLLVDATTSEMRRTMRLLEISASIPRRQLNELTRTRIAVQKALNDVAAAHQKAQSEAQLMLTSTPVASGSINQTKLMHEVESLIRSSAAP